MLLKLAQRLGPALNNRSASSAAQGANGRSALASGLAAFSRRPTLPLCSAPSGSAPPLVTTAG